MVQQNISINADNSKAKQAIQELRDLFNQTQKDIDRVNKASLGNNNTISNKQQANVQNDFADMRELTNSIRELIETNKRNGNTSRADMLESTYGSQLENIQKSIEALANANRQKLDQIQGSTTTSSSAFRSNEYDSVNAQATMMMSQQRSDIHNLMNSIRKTMNNFEVGAGTGRISYNRMQEYRSANESNSQRIKELLENFKDERHGGNPASGYNQLQDDLRKMRSLNGRAQAKVNSGSATRAEINQAKAIDEQVKELEKLNQAYKQMREELEMARAQNTKFKDRMNIGDYEVGTDPNSFRGQLEKRGYSIARGAIAAGIAGVATGINQGNSLRMSAFDNIKGVAYANGGYHADNHVLDSLSQTGYQYGFNGSEMSGFLNAYSATTANTDNAVGVARSWARQSRITGGSTDSTQNLERSAGDATSMNGTQMQRLGNQITNAITSSGMSSKASEQQQGLAQLFSNATNYGANSRNLADIAGMQASLSKYGAQFQGTTGANNLSQAIGVIGNYNSLQSRIMFSRGTGSRYTGLKGQAQLMEDMQNMNKDPRVMNRVLGNYMQFANGDKQIAAYNLSLQNPSVSMDTWEKLLTARQNGDLSEKNFRKYLKDDSVANRNDRSYQDSGASSVQKYNTALANSAMKASESLDSFRNAIAKITETSGMMSGLGTFLGSAVGSSLGSVAPQVLGGLLTGGKGEGSVLRSVGSRLGRTRLGGRVLEKGSSILARSKNLGARAWSKLSPFALRGAEEAGTKVAIAKGAGKFGSKLIPGLGTVASLGFALNDLKNGRIGSALLDGAGAIPGIGIGADILSALGLGNKLDGVLGSGKGLASGLSAEGKVAKYGKYGLMAGGSIFAMLGLGDLAKNFINKHNDKVHIKGNSVYLNSDSLKGVATQKDGFDFSGALTGASGKKLAKLLNHKNSKFHNDDDWSVLKGYNKMLEKAKTIIDEAKSISLNGDSSSDDSSSDDSSEKASGEGVEALRSVAKKLGKELNVDPSFIFGQMMHETGGKFDNLAGKNNYSGMTYVGQSGAKQGKHQPDGPGYYADFDTLDDYANAFGSTLKADHVQGSKSVEEYVNHLKAGGYFSGDLGTYISAVKKFASQYANGGIRSFATGTGFITSQPTMVNSRDLMGEAGTEAFIPLNSGHSLAGMSALNDLAGVFNKKLVSPSDVSNVSGNTTINPSYNINLTIQGGTDDPESLAQTIATKVRAMLSDYEQQLSTQNTLQFYANETRTGY